MTETADANPQTRNRQPMASAIVFAISYIVLFLAMLVAMRVPAGQIVPWDFSMNYGPAQFYALSALFKLFGQSLFLERLYDLLLQSLVVTSVYAIAANYCRWSIAVVAGAAALMWQTGLSGLTASPAVPVCLLNLVGVAAILPTYVSWIPKRRLMVAGGMAGLALLFRYDTGVTLLLSQMLILASVAYWHSGSPRVPFLIDKVWPLFAGFAALVVPYVLCYLLFAPLRVFPISLYLAAHSGSEILNKLEIVQIFLVVAITAVAWLAGVVRAFRSASGRLAGDEREERRYRGFLVAFGLLAFAMCLAGISEPGSVQIYLGIMPALLLMAILVEHRSALRGLLQSIVPALAVLSLIAATCSFLKV